MSEHAPEWECMVELDALLEASMAYRNILNERGKIYSDNRPTKVAEMQARETWEAAIDKARGDNSGEEPS